MPYVRNSRYEAARASRLLTAACGFPVTVTGVIVPVGATNLTVKTPPRDVRVVQRRQLQTFLTQLAPTGLSDTQIAIRLSNVMAGAGATEPSGADLGARICCRIPRPKAGPGPH